MNRNKTADQFNELQREMAVKYLTDTNAPDSEILRYSDIYRPFVEGVSMYDGDFLRHEEDDQGNTIVYKSKKNHVTQVAIAPGTENGNNVYEKIGYITIGNIEYRIWVRPINKNDYYQVGDIVAYNGVLKRNTLENNGFSPDQFGWEDYVV